jgi:hypothetical protein
MFSPTPCFKEIAQILNEKLMPRSLFLANTLRAVFLLVLFYDLEDGGDKFLRNINWNSMDYRALYARR